MENELFRIPLPSGLPNPGFAQMVDLPWYALAMSSVLVTGSETSDDKIRRKC